MSPSLARCELTHLSREFIDVDRARAQHRAYEDGLRALGCDVRRLPTEPDLPDAVFVEDTAVVFDELAVVARPGAPSRRAEVPSVAAALASFRALEEIRPPGTLDGGDVLVLGRDVFVGLSTRTNEDGVGQLRRALVPRGYAVRPLAVRSCLHLKSAVTRVGPSAVLLNPGLGGRARLRRVRAHRGPSRRALGGQRAGRGRGRRCTRTRSPARATGCSPAASTCASWTSRSWPRPKAAVTCCSLVFDAGP